MVNPQNQNPAELLRRFKDSWLDKANPDHPGEYEESEKTVDSLMQIIIKYCSETNTIFLLEPTLNILLKNQSQFDNQDLESINNFENIENRVIKFLRDDESFKVEVDNHFKELDSPESLYKTHPILSHFLLPKPGDETDQPPPPVPIKIIVLVVLVVLALGSVVLWIYFHRPDPIFSLCESDFRTSKVKIDCGDEESSDDKKLKLSNASKLSDPEMDTLINKLDADFHEKPDPSTLIALNNAKVLQALRSKQSSINDIYPIGVAVPLSGGAEGSVEAGKHILSGIAQKQEEFNNKLSLDKKLFVVQADDQNNNKLAMEIAQELGKNSQILGVIGPYSSSNLAYILPTYTGYQLPLISPSATVAMKDLKAEKILVEFFKQKNANNPFFFRTVEDTDASIKVSLEYLKTKGYKQLIIFCDDEDLFSKSLLLRLIEQNKKYGFSIVQFMNKEGKKSDFISIRKTEELAEVTKDLIAKYRDQNAKTAIFYLQGAYKDTEGLKAKILDVLETNQGEFLVVGGNTVDQPGLFSELKDNAKILQQIIVMKPWFPLEKMKEFKHYRYFWDSKDIVDWRYVMAYDATQVLFSAITSRKNKSEYPTRQEIQQVLTGDLVQNKDCANKTTPGISYGIITTNITFNGSDRCPNPDGLDGYVLIKPVEIKPGEWKWQPVNKNTTQ